MITIKDVSGVQQHLSVENPHEIEVPIVPAFATATQVNAGTSTNTIVNPAELKRYLNANQPNIPTVPNFATTADINLGTSKTTIVNPFELKKYVAEQRPTIPAFASAAQITQGTSTNTIVNPSGLERKAIEIINRITKSDVGLGNVPNQANASNSEAVAGSVNNKTMTPYLVKLAIGALADTGDTWTTNLRAGGDYGWIRHNPTGITLQWGQSHSLNAGEAAFCRYSKTFSARPWAVIGSSHTWTGDTSIPRNEALNEVTVSVISRSVTNVQFQCVANRFEGGNTDGAVFSWIAIGHTNLNATNFPEARRSVPWATNIQANMGQPRPGTDIVAPRGTS